MKEIGSDTLYFMLAETLRNVPLFNRSTSLLNSEITITEERCNSPEMGGMVCWDEDERDYEIFINTPACKDFKEAYTTIAHELIHILVHIYHYGDNGPYAEHEAIFKFYAEQVRPWMGNLEIL